MIIDQFADIKILRYTVPGFDSLSLREKLLIYHLSEAALWGRDIYWHQNSAQGLRMRHAFEAIYRLKASTEPALAEYVKRLWFASGPYHHYSNDKFTPAFSQTQLIEWANEACVSFCPDDLSLIFDPDLLPKKVSFDTSADVVANSAVNFYDHGISAQQVQDFYAQPNRHPLNSKLCCDANGNLFEQVWKSNGMYGPLIDRIVTELNQAAQYACTNEQRDAIQLLIQYYRSGGPTDFDAFNIQWVADKASNIDFINGFIEVYDDPLGLKGTWESIVELTDANATKQIETIAANAQWFEDHSPIDPQFRKPNVKGVSMNVIDAVMLGGDCYPATPIGVNLPNADWIREQHGSKSISLANITRAHHNAAADVDQESTPSSNTSAAPKPQRGSVLREFAATPEEIERSRRFGQQADELHTQLHECLGHGSGQMMPDVTLDNLGAYGSTIEEARADLFALYFMADERMLQLGILTSLEAAWAHYDSYLRSGLLVQLARIEEGRNIEEAHMRNRALIARWVLERAQPQGIAQMFTDGQGRHFVSIADYQGLRQLFGLLLREVQRIKSQGDYEAARNLVENYGVRIDPELHAEVRHRYAALGIAPFSGFVNPRLQLETDAQGNPTNVTISYNEDYDQQMLRYSQQYSLPI